MPEQVLDVRAPMVRLVFDLGADKHSQACDYEELTSRSFFMSSRRPFSRAKLRALTSGGRGRGRPRLFGLL